MPLFRADPGFPALLEQDVLFMVVHDAGVKGVVVGIPACRIASVRRSFERGLVLG